MMNYGPKSEGGKGKAKKYPPKRILTLLHHVERDFPLYCGKQSHSMTKDIVLSKDISLDNVWVDDLVLHDLPSFSRENPIDFLEFSAHRYKLEETLTLFHKVLNELWEENRMPKAQKSKFAASVIRDSWLNTEKKLGPIPGVEVGDRFQYRAELRIIGLHHQYDKGIDYFEKDGTILATSIVSTGRYANFMYSSDILIYSGEGGNPKVCTQLQVKDQVLKNGNLALKNSMERRTPVRVIRKGINKDSKLTTCRRSLYVYDGLYFVEKYWKERGKFGKLVFKFELRKISGITRALLEELDRNRQIIPVMRRLDYKKPSPYVSNIDYSVVSNQPMSSGCDCIDGCSDSEDCSCKVKNGKALPYDYGERLVRRKICIYECGPSCKCYGSCINRVTQRGIKFRLEVFKRKSRRWGVRSLVNIPSGSFICEYVRETHETKEVEGRVGGNEHCLDKANYNGVLMSENDNVLCLDNAGRLINHSNYPNLYVQNVFHGDIKMPRMMLFAMKDIYPFQELTYDYNCRTKF